MTTRSVQTMFAPIADPLAEAEQVLRKELHSQYPYVDELVRHGFLLGGKRLRPALLLLTAQAAGNISPQHLTLAAVVEMIHTATLVHDDVLDEAEMRRHLATVNSRWDNEASILLGDFLFTHAFYLASSLDTTLACRWIGKATNVVCEGELRQKGSRGDFLISEEQYISIIDAKTAALCEVSCRLGAHYAQAPEAIVQQMADYGRYLGIAFQIADDVLDLLGTEQDTGKSLGTDLDKQKPTLPIIRLLQVAGLERREEILEVLNDDNPQRRRSSLLPLLEATQAVSYAQDVAARHARLAQEQLAQLNPSPAEEVLRALGDFVVSRSH